MKKWLSLLLCLLLMLAMLTACGKDKAENDTKPKAEDKTDTTPIIGDTSVAVVIGTSGNIEMALNIQDVSWSNQLSLPNRLYGLRQVILYPAHLNSDSGALINRQSPLQYPLYGADGRVSELVKDTLVGVYDTASKDFIYSPNQDATGVSGIGKTASVSKRAFAITHGQSAIISYKNAATNATKDAIRLYGGKLAAIALQYDNAGADEVVSEGDIAMLKDLIATLKTSNNNISEALKSAVLVVLAAEKSLTDDQWTTAAALAEGKDIVAYLAALTPDYDSVVFPSALTEMIAQYEDICDKLDAAEAALPSVGNLLVASDIRIGGHTISEIKTDYAANGMGSDVAKDLFYKVSDGTLTFGIVGGIFTDIANLTGNYTSSMAFPEGTTIEGLDLNMLGSQPVHVEGANGSAGSLGALSATDAIVNAQDPASSNADAALTDVFGYMIDLLFRTNATESDLLLQIAPANRYGEGAMDKTEVNGSNVTFTINEEYTAERIEGLAQGIRVVFFDNNNAILAVGILDADDGELSDDTYKMNLILSEYSIDDNGIITLNGVKADSKLCPLTANVETAVSTLVYLDGDVIDNSYSHAQTGLEMILNLQFASSAELKPSVDSDLMDE